MKRLISALVLTIFLSATAHADNIGTVSLLLPGGSGQLGDAVSLTPAGSSNSIQTNLGPYVYDLSNPSNSAVAKLLGMNTANGNSVTAAGYCISVTTGINVGTHYSNFSVDSIAASGPSAGMLGGLSASQTTNVLKLMADYTLAGGNLTNETKSSTLLNDALGSAIWEATNGKGTDSPNPFVVNGGSNDVGIKARTPTSSTTLAAAISLANSWLAGLATQTTEEDPKDVFALVGFDQYGHSLQTQAIVTQCNIVPEPKTMAGLTGMGLLAMAMGAIAVFRRR